MSREHTTFAVAGAFAAMGAAWPSALCALTSLAATPYERALGAAYCGAGPQALEILGHCPACWAGAGAFLIAAAVLAAPRARTAARAR